MSVQDHVSPVGGANLIIAMTLRIKSFETKIFLSKMHQKKSELQLTTFCTKSYLVPLFLAT